MNTSPRLVFRIVVALFFFAVFASNLMSNELFIFNFDHSESLWRIGLPAFVTNRTFVNAMTAIELVEVKCDGRVLVPETRYIAGRPDQTETDVPSSYVVYRFTRGFFQCWTDIRQNGGQTSEIRRFILPEDANVVAISYRIRSPSGSLSGIVSAKYIASEQQTQLLMLHAPRK